MTTLELETEPLATDLTVTEDELVINLSDGRRIAVPTAWYPRLSYATPQEQQSWIILGNGYAIEWPELDEHVGIAGILAGRHSRESPKSLKRWLESRSTTEE
jgi:hypothetical protein